MALLVSPACQRMHCLSVSRGMIPAVETEGTGEAALKNKQTNYSPPMENVNV